MRKITTVLAAFALAITLGACGDDAEGGNATPEGNGGGATSGGTEQAAGSLADLAASIGDRTASTSTAHMVFTGGVGGQEITGEGDIEIGPETAKMTMAFTTPEGSMTMTMLDEVLYLKLPQEIEPGKPWIKIDANGDDPMAKALAGTTDQMRESADPRQALEQFKNAGTITEQREEELNGEQTTHYSIMVDVEKLAAEQTDETAKKALQEAGVTEYPVELWVNGDELPVRMKVDMPTPDPTTGKTTTATVQVDYTKWGEPVEIVAPSAAEIATMPS